MPNSRENAILQFLQELTGHQMHGFIVALQGETVAQGYWKPYTAQRPHRLYSVSKSVVSLAVGILAQENKLNLDHRIMDYFPDDVQEHTPELLRQVTLRHMLCMATCYDRAQYTPLDAQDWTRPFFEGVPVHVPGTVFSYDTSATQVLCALVEKLTGQEILAFMEERLFRHIGMTGEKRWLKDGVGVSQGGTGLIMTLPDLCRLAQFCMGDGRGIVSAEYLRAATSWQMDTSERSGPEERFGYGYQFWQTRCGFAMYGLGGQMAICIPETGLCLCTLADLMDESTGVQPIYDAFFRNLGHLEQLPTNAEDAQRLQQKLNSLALDALPHHVQAEPGGEISIFLERKALPFSRICIAPGAVTLTLDDREWVLPYVCGTWVQAEFPRLGEQCLVSGGWKAPGRFQLHAELWETNACGLHLYVVLSGERATVRVQSSFWEVEKGWWGDDWGYIEQS